MFNFLRFSGLEHSKPHRVAVLFLASNADFYQSEKKTMHLEKAKSYIKRCVEKTNAAPETCLSLVGHGLRQLKFQSLGRIFGPSALLKSLLERSDTAI